MIEWLWRIIHNCIVHPLMGICPCALTYWLHDITPTGLE